MAKIVGLMAKVKCEYCQGIGIEFLSEDNQVNCSHCSDEEDIGRGYILKELSIEEILYYLKQTINCEHCQSSETSNVLNVDLFYCRKLDIFKKMEGCFFFNRRVSEKTT